MNGPVFLTGLMGSGKTTVGQMLAQRLGWQWIDLDHAIERRAGKKVAQIFSEQGEQVFRQMESQELAFQAKITQHVVSCGGGVVLAEKNRLLLKRNVTLYLAVSPELLAKRLKGIETKKRPLMRGRTPLKALQRLQRERAHFYRSSATIVLRASPRPEQVAERAFFRLRSTLTPQGARVILLKP